MTSDFNGVHRARIDTRVERRHRLKAKASTASPRSRHFKPEQRAGESRHQEATLGRVRESLQHQTKAQGSGATAANAGTGGASDPPVAAADPPPCQKKLKKCSPRGREDTCTNLPRRWLVANVHHERLAPTPATFSNPFALRPLPLRRRHRLRLVCRRAGRVEDVAAHRSSQPPHGHLDKTCPQNTQKIAASLIREGAQGEPVLRNGSQKQRL